MPAWAPDEPAAVPVPALVIRVAEGAGSRFAPDWVLALQRVKHEAESPRRQGILSSVR